MINLGNVVADSTIRIPFNSFNAAGASDGLTGLDSTKVKIYKDGSLDERTSANGITVDDDFDGKVGLHEVEIDLSDDTQSGFYEVGSTYDVAIDSVTIDGETVRFWVGRFDIQNRSVVNNSGSVHFSDPKRLPKSSVVATEFYNREPNSTGQRPSTSSLFWTDQIASYGADVDTDYTANTYKTLVDLVDGAGILTGVIGPTAGGSETTTFEISVDGIISEIVVSVSSGDRAYLGYTTGDSTYPLSPGAYTLNSGKDTFSLSSAEVPDIMGMLIAGTPLLEYSSSLKVRAKHSVAVTGTSSQERRSGVLYYDGFK